MTYLNNTKQRDPHQALQQLSTYISNISWSSSKRSVKGTIHGRSIYGRYFACGMCVSVMIEWPLIHVSDVCLLLATLTEMHDYAIYVEQEQLWLLRHYPLSLTEVELDLLMQQQITIASLLTGTDNLTGVAACGR